MEKDNNKYKIQGTIYAKKHEVITGKKDPTQSYDKYIITLEVTSSEERNTKDGTKYTTKTELPQFEAFNPKYDIEYFRIGDFVEIWFYMSGQKFTYKSGPKTGQDGIINRSPITFIKHADLGTNKSPAKVSNTDILERESVFITPDPGSSIDDDDGLPF